MYYVLVKRGNIYEYHTRLQAETRMAELVGDCKIEEREIIVIKGDKLSFYTKHTGVAVEIRE